MTERVLGSRSLPSPSSLRSDTSPRGRGKWGCRGRHFLRKSIKLRGKDPRKPKGFSWSLQGGPEGNRNPSGLVFFSQSFLLEKQKKRLRGSCRFSRRIPTLICVPLTTKRHEFAFVFCLLPLPAAAVQVLRANDFVCKSGLDKGGVLCYDALG